MYEEYQAKLRESDSLGRIITMSEEDRVKVKNCHDFFKALIKAAAEVALKVSVV